MITFTVVQSAEDSPNSTRATHNESVKWCRFNDETIYWKSPHHPHVLPNKLHELGGNLQIGQGNLYLVVQAGNSFLSHFAWVRIVVNKGRYLAVDLTDKEVDDIEHEAACFGLCPLPENTTIFEVNKRTKKQSSSKITSLVAMISQTLFAETLKRLAGFRTRHSLTSEFSTASDWIKSKLEHLGFAVSKHTISVGNGTSFNVVADMQGSGTNRRLVIVTAHLDSVNTKGGVTSVAPGADDNGSGAAGVLEIGRILALRSVEHDLRLILFGGEEQGLLGSRQYVESLNSADRIRLDSVINMDMIATLNTSTPTVLLEGATISQALMDDLTEAAHNYTSLLVQTSLNPFASDHVSFITASLPAILTIEGADSANHNIHTANDTLDHIHYDLASDILKMNVAVVAQRLGIRDSMSPIQSSSSVVA